jgi:hypothetical protein
VIPEGRRSPFRKETDQASERSDAGTSILPRLIGIVKRNLSEVKRRLDAARSVSEKSGGTRFFWGH